MATGASAASIVRVTCVKLVAEDGTRRLAECIVVDEVEGDYVTIATLPDVLIGTDGSWLDADSDDGTVSDGQEIENGTDPLNASDDLPSSENNGDMDDLLENDEEALCPDGSDECPEADCDCQTPASPLSPQWIRWLARRL